MPYLLAMDIPGSERHYYAGPNRDVERKSEKSTHELALATKFETEDEAADVLGSLTGDYEIIEAR